MIAKEYNVPTMMTINEVSERTGVAPYRIRQLYLDGKIVGFRAGKKILINLERFCEFLNSNTESRL